MVLIKRKKVLCLTTSPRLNGAFQSSLFLAACWSACYRKWRQSHGSTLLLPLLESMQMEQFLALQNIWSFLTFACEAPPTPPSLLFPAPVPFLLCLLKEMLQTILSREPSGWKLLWWDFYISMNSTNFGSFSAKLPTTWIHWFLWSVKKCSCPWSLISLSHTHTDIHTHMQKRVKWAKNNVSVKSAMHDRLWLPFEKKGYN